MRKAVVFNLGCKVNQYECDVLSEELIKRGYDVKHALEYADLYIVNTCAVTSEAEKKSRQAIARCRKFNKNAKIIMCGCACEKNAKAFKKENVIHISGVADKMRILSHIDDYELSVNISNLPKVHEITHLNYASRTRAFVKIQDGCNNFCSYCIIPYLRGRSRSRLIMDIVKEVKILSKNTREIVLTGINLKQYGEDTGESLTELINSLKEIDIRIRLGSFYVEAINEELLNSLFSLKQFCPHFHLSLQSGSDEVLKAMNRKYTAKDYLQKINLIRRFDSNASITTDIIAGFPTESAQNFEENLEFIKKVQFSDIHVFPYSRREGTTAAKFPVLDKETVTERRNILLEKKQILINNYLLNNINIPQKVLFEEQENGLKSGYSDRYIRIYKKTDKEIETVIPIVLYKDGLKGD